MKKLGKIKLNQLSKAEMENREFSELRGGGDGDCECGCAGPSSTVANRNANYENGYYESAGDAQWCICNTMPAGYVFV